MLGGEIVLIFCRKILRNDDLCLKFSFVPSFLCLLVAVAEF